MLAYGTEVLTTVAITASGYWQFPPFAYYNTTNPTYSLDPTSGGYTAGGLPIPVLTPADPGGPGKTTWWGAPRLHGFCNLGESAPSMGPQQDVRAHFCLGPDEPLDAPTQYALNRMAQTVWYTLIICMQVWHIWNVRTRNNSLLQQGIFSNPAVFGGIAWELSIMCIVVYVPWSYSLNNTLFQAYEVHVCSCLLTYYFTLTYLLTH